MALRGATMKELMDTASHWASNKTADDYIAEVVRRVNKI